MKWMKFWEVAKSNNPSLIKVLTKILWDITYLCWNIPDVLWKADKGKETLFLLVSVHERTNRGDTLIELTDYGAKNLVYKGH